MLSSKYSMLQKFHNILYNGVFWIICYEMLHLVFILTTKWHIFDSILIMERVDNNILCDIFADIVLYVMNMTSPVGKW